MSVTKNHQSDAQLRTMARAAFPEKEVQTITELTEGMFNAAYRVDFADGTASILKIAAATADGLMSNEVNLMQAEVTAMQTLQSHGVPHVAKVQYSDFTRTLCSGAYFFMEVIPGRSLFSMKDELTEETVSAVKREVGLLQRQSTAICRDTFGLAGDERRFATMYELERYMIGNVLHDAEGANVTFCFTAEELLACLERDRSCFDEVQTARLVHLDMWDGNLFVHDGHLSGVIDWERTLWGDPLMDDPFRSQNQHPAFLEGYGKTTFTPAEQRRILWYDACLDLTMITESYYRQYVNEDWNRYLQDRLAGTWEKLRHPIAK